MSNESKKRRRSSQGPEESHLEAKRVKVEPEGIQHIGEELNEQSHSVKKKKKHKHHHSEINEVTECFKDEAPEMLQDDGCNINRLLEDDYESRKSSRKHKHHRHHRNDNFVESMNTNIRYEHDGEEIAGTESAERLQPFASETSSAHKKKKKKKHRHHEEEECHSESEVVHKQEFINLTDCVPSTQVVGSTVLESPAVEDIDIDISAHDLNCEEGRKKKKKKKHHHQESVDDVAITDAVKHEDIESELSSSHKNHKGKSSLSSQEKSVTAERQAETSYLLPAEKQIRERHLHLNTEEIRFNAGKEFEEFQPENNSDQLWWEDVANNPDLEMWLVRAPLDFSPSFIEGARGMLYDSVLVPEPGRPGEGFQVSIQGVQQSKLIVLLPSKQDKKLHVASDVNGYVTITRAPAFARADVDLEPSAAESECEADKKRKKKKKHKSKETKEETTYEVEPKKHKKNRSSD